MTGMEVPDMAWEVSDVLQLQAKIVQLQAAVADVKHKLIKLEDLVDRDYKKLHRSVKGLQEQSTKHDTATMMVNDELCKMNADLCQMEAQMKKQATYIKVACAGIGIGIAIGIGSGIWHCWKNLWAMVL